ncbi:MAG TPA: YdeI/OmpD-associated family protein [Fluviicola sp.]|nr:YdeI/OmpD-associated family protein [Fluviicola sp.]
MNDAEKPLIDGDYLMERYPGKGGWTYVVLPGVPRERKTPFNWTTVRGRIDAYELEHYTLMPIKGGGLFLPVKAEIRKKIKKEAGDTVRVVLYPETRPLGVPEEWIECMKLQPPAYERFSALSQSAQKQLINWIYEAKTEETKVKRMAEGIERLVG